MERDGRDAVPPQTVLDALPDMVYALDAEFRFTFVNEAMAAATGYDREELFGAPASLLFDEAAIERGTGSRERLRADDTEYRRVETGLLTADGDRVPCEIRVQSLPKPDDGTVGDGDGRATGTVGVVRNVADRGERERERRVRSTAMEASIDGMAILDADQEFVFVNESHATVYGYDAPDALLGDSWRLCHPEEELARFEKTVMPTLFEAGEWRGEAVGLREDGTTFPQALSLSLMADGRAVCIVRDITERKRRERELEEKKEALEEFARVVSHDLRSPLNVAQGRLELARGDSTDDEHLAAAADAVDRSIGLVDDLLTLSREGAKAGEREPVDLGTVAAECWENVETDAASLAVETERTVQADPSRLKELLENLMRNAIEHGGGDVTVTVADAADGFYVADDGDGIAETERDRVFETGYSTADEGTGFGLDIVRSIADAHGWSVRAAESETGGARLEFAGLDGRG